MIQSNHFSWLSKRYHFLIRKYLLLGGCLLTLVSYSNVKAQIKAIKPFENAYAIVVGVSDYQHEKIDDLNYADADARAFAQFLEQETAWKIPPSNLVLLENEKATYGRFIAELSAISTQLQAKDRLIIYFSGHGDVEYINEDEKMGFLLFYDTSPTTYEGGGACKVNTLDEALSELVLNRQVQVILITDACRSGNLAGSKLGGPNATTAAMAALFQNTTKILSCEPTQYSLEGERWGGGRGLFSYHLVEGLRGKADKNENRYVSLLELERYVEDLVLRESGGQQLPMTFGSKTVRLNKINPDLYLGASDGLAKEDSTINLIDKYIAFQAAMEQKHLLYPEEGAAFTIFSTMGNSPEAIVFKKGMKTNLISALQDEAQQALNEYITSPGRELSKRWTNSGIYAYYPDYLDTAAELLGLNDYFYNDIKSRAHYFRGVNLRLQADEEEGADSLYLLAQQQQQISLAYKGKAPHVFNEQGLLHRRLGEKRAELTAFQKAHEFSPKWGLALTNLAYTYRRMKNYEEAEARYKEAIDLDPTLSLPYYNLAVLYERIGTKEQAVPYYQIALKSENPVPSAYYNLADIYSYTTDSLSVAEALLQELLQLEPQNEKAYSLLGLIYLQQEQNESARVAFERALSIEPESIYTRSNLAYLNEIKEDYEQAILEWKKILKINDEYYPAYLGLMANYSHINQDKEAIDLLETMLEKGYTDYEELTSYEGLERLFDQRKVQQLMKAYFPDR